MVFHFHKSFTVSITKLQRPLLQFIVTSGENYYLVLVQVQFRVFSLVQLQFSLVIVQLQLQFSLVIVQFSYSYSLVQLQFSLVIVQFSLVIVQFSYSLVQLQFSLVIVSSLVNNFSYVVTAWLQKISKAIRKGSKTTLNQIRQAFICFVLFFIAHCWESA